MLDSVTGTALLPKTRVSYDHGPTDCADSHHTDCLTSKVIVSKQTEYGCRATVEGIGINNSTKKLNVQHKKCRGATVEATLRLHEPLYCANRTYGDDESICFTIHLYKYI